MSRRDEFVALWQRYTDSSDGRKFMPAAFVAAVFQRVAALDREPSDDVAECLQILDRYWVGEIAALGNSTRLIDGQAIHHHRPSLSRLL